MPLLQSPIDSPSNLMNVPGELPPLGTDCAALLAIAVTALKLSAALAFRM
jgi:hypothetical protein